jgi:hypothetical protein
MSASTSQNNHVCSACKSSANFRARNREGIGLQSTKCVPASMSTLWSLFLVPKLVIEMNGPAHAPKCLGGGWGGWPGGGKQTNTSATSEYSCHSLEESAGREAAEAVDNDWLVFVAWQKQSRMIGSIDRCCFGPIKQMPGDSERVRQLFHTAKPQLDFMLSASGATPSAIGFVIAIGR